MLFDARGLCVFVPLPASTLHGGDGSDFPLYWSCWKREGDHDVYLSLPVYLCRRAGGMRTGKRRGRACRQSCVLYLLLCALASSFSVSAKHAFSAPPERGTNVPPCCFSSTLSLSLTFSSAKLHVSGIKAVTRVQHVGTLLTGVQTARRPPVELSRS